MTVTHFPNCTADYPEKVKGEAPQQLTRIDLGDGEYVWQCVDCGAASEVRVDNPDERKAGK